MNSRSRCPLWTIIAFLVATSAATLAFGQDSLNDLLSDLSSDDVAVRRSAAESLSRIKPLDEAAIPALVKALDDRELNPYIAWALNNAGPKAGEAVKPRLLSVLRAKKMSSAERNVIHSLHAAALPALRELLTDADVGHRMKALGILRIMGPSASAAAPDVKLALAEPQREVRLGAAACYWAITGNTKDTIPVLISGLQAPMGQSAHWCEAARTLGEIGPPAKEAVPLLVDMLKGTRETTKGLKVYIGPPMPWFHVRTEAAIALGRIGPDAKAAVPALIRLASKRMKFEIPPDHYACDRPAPCGGLLPMMPRYCRPCCAASRRNIRSIALPSKRL